jgi:hypothetical protein
MLSLMHLRIKREHALVFVFFLFAQILFIL